MHCAACNKYMDPAIEEPWEAPVNGLGQIDWRHKGPGPHRWRKVCSQCLDACGTEPLLSASNPEKR